MCSTRKLIYEQADASTFALDPNVLLTASGISLGKGRRRRGEWMRLQPVNRKGMGLRGSLPAETAGEVVVLAESGFKQFSEARLFTTEIVRWVRDHDESWTALERL